MPHSNLVPALLVPLFVWRIYRRVRRTIGRQMMRRGRMISYIIIFGIISLCVAVLSARSIPACVGFGGGLFGGLAVGLVALRLTRFETNAGIQYYTPNPYLGVAVSLLLVGRLVYRLSAIYTTGTEDGPPPRIELSPLTVAVFGLLAGYYLTYYAGILIHFRRERITAAQPALETPTA